MMMKSWRVALAAAALGCSAAVGAAPATGPDPRFTGRDLFDLSAASDAQIEVKCSCSLSQIGSLLCFSNVMPAAP